jgi:hypothetical protein
MVEIDLEFTQRGGTYVFVYQSSDGGKHYFVVVLPLRGADMSHEFRLNGVQASDFGAKLSESLILFVNDGPLVMLHVVANMFQPVGRGDYVGTPQNIDVSRDNPDINAYCRLFSQVHWNGPRNSTGYGGIDNSIATVFGYPIDTAILNYYIVGRAMGGTEALRPYGFALLEAAMAQGWANGAPNREAKRLAFQTGYDIGILGESPSSSQEVEWAAMISYSQSLDSTIGPWAASLWPNSRRARNIVTRSQHDSLPGNIDRRNYFSRPGFLDFTAEQIREILFGF